jgi:hypothetical protein
VIGLVLAAALNVDSVGLSQALWRDDGLRESLVAASATYIELGEELAAEEARTQLTELALPIGWSFQKDDSDPDTPLDPRDFPSSAQGWLLKILGLVLTGLAISQGSPFWFDVLNRFVKLRSAGKRPEPKTNGKSG